MTREQRLESAAEYSRLAGHYAGRAEELEAAGQDAGHERRVAAFCRSEAARLTREADADHDPA